MHADATVHGTKWLRSWYAQPHEHCVGVALTHVSHAGVAGPTSIEG